MNDVHVVVNIIVMWIHIQQKHLTFWPFSPDLDIIMYFYP